MMTMTAAAQRPLSDASVLCVTLPARPSALVARILSAANDPAKTRVRAMLSAMDDRQLIESLGLTHREIAALRSRLTLTRSNDP
jgi:hypothetical protein